MSTAICQESRGCGGFKVVLGSGGLFYELHGFVDRCRAIEDWGSVLDNGNFFMAIISGLMIL